MCYEEMFFLAAFKNSPTIKIELCTDGIWKALLMMIYAFIPVFQQYFLISIKQKILFSFSLLGKKGMFPNHFKL